MTPTIHLHIGEPKSGTTYLQAMLKENREALEGVGLTTPRQREQVMASQDAIRGKAGGSLWSALAAKLSQWEGSDALVTMETLCRAEQPAVRRAIEAFGDAPVRVHITVRDLLRSLPAQWQQTTHHRKTWSWSEYCNAVVSADDAHPATRNFWSQHDLADFLDRWAGVVGSSNVYVITVPPSGSNPELLWQRFTQGLGISPLQVREVSPTNESLGATSADLLRRLNTKIADLDLTEKQYNVLMRGLLAREILAKRTGEEPKVTPPRSALPWAQRHSDRIIEAVRSSGVHVVGDLEELRPHPGELTDQPIEPTNKELVETSLQAILGLAQELASTR